MSEVNQFQKLTEGDLSFHEKVQKEKKNSLPVLDNTIAIYARLSENKKLQYNPDAFIDKDINYDSVKKYLQQLQSGDNKTIHDAMFGGVNFENKKVVLDEVRKLGPFQTPQELIQKISEHIKSKMSYSFMDWLEYNTLISRDLSDRSHKSFENLSKSFLGKSRVDGLDNESSIGISSINISSNVNMANIIDPDKLVLNIQNFFDVNQIKYDQLVLQSLKEEININTTEKEINQKIMTLLSKYLDTGVSSNFNFMVRSEVMSKFDLKVQELINEGKIKQENIDKNQSDAMELLNNLRKVVQEKDSTTMKMLLSGGKIDDVFELIGEMIGIDSAKKLIFSQMSQDGKEIEEYLNTINTGVCRHFSSIAKLIYEELKGEVVNKQESELLTVVNMNNSHTYNVLMTENPDGSIKKEYLDITKFIQGKSLWQQEVSQGIYGKKYDEFLVRNHKVQKNGNQIG